MECTPLLTKDEAKFKANHKADPYEIFELVTSGVGCMFFSDERDLKKQLAKALTDHDIRRHYYKPEKKNFPGIDSFTIEDGTLVFYQMTGSYYHPVKAEGPMKLLSCVPTGLVDIKKKRCKIVFIVPDKGSFAATPQKIIGMADVKGDAAYRVAYKAWQDGGQQWLDGCDQSKGTIAQLQQLWAPKKMRAKWLRQAPRRQAVQRAT